jgi:hypothetical protein
VAVPLSNVGPFSSSADPTLNVVESYTVEVIRPGEGRGETGSQRRDRQAPPSSSRFDNIGTKSIAKYAAYADKYISA